MKSLKILEKKKQQQENPHTAHLAKIDYIENSLSIQKG